MEGPEVLEMGIIRAGHTVHISGFTDEEVKTEKVDTPWFRARKGS